MILTDLYAPRAERMKASEIRELLKLLDKPGIISFAGGIPDPALFPAQEFQDATRRALESDAAHSTLQYAASEGLPALRAWIAQHMRSLGVPAVPENILITSGSQQALDHIGKLFIGTGDAVALGFPTYLGALGAFNAYEPLYVRLDPNGNRSVERMREEAQGAKIKLAYVTPDFANPTGETLSKAARLAILAQAEEMGAAIVEDAAYQALRFEGENIAPILALEAAQSGTIETCRTLYCGSFSKTLAPGLRIGWVCAAKTVIDKLVLLKQAGDLHAATLNQAIVAEVAGSIFETHLPRLRAAYGARLTAMLDALERYMPDGVRWTNPDGGMFVWLTLPTAFDATALLSRALEHDVAFVPGAAFFPDGSGRNTLRLNFSKPDEEMIEDGIRRLAGLVREGPRQSQPC